MEIKEFIKLSSLGFLGLYSCGISSLANSDRPLAIQLYTIRDAVSQNLEKALEKLAALAIKSLKFTAITELSLEKAKTNSFQFLKTTV